MSCLTSIAKPGVGYGLLDWLPRTPIAYTTFRRNRLEIMAKSDDPRIRAAAASNPMLSTETLESLSSDADLLVRSWVARNPECPRSILRNMRLVEDDPSLKAYLDWLLVE